MKPMQRSVCVPGGKPRTCMCIYLGMYLRSSGNECEFILLAVCCGFFLFFISGIWLNGLGIDGWQRASLCSALPTYSILELTPSTCNASLRLPRIQ